MTVTALPVPTNASTKAAFADPVSITTASRATTPERVARLKSKVVDVAPSYTLSTTTTPTRDKTSTTGSNERVTVAEAEDCSPSDAVTVKVLGPFSSAAGT